MSACVQAKNLCKHVVGHRFMGRVAVITQQNKTDLQNISCPGLCPEDGDVPLKISPTLIVLLSKE